MALTITAASPVDRVPPTPAPTPRTAAPSGGATRPVEVQAPAPVAGPSPAQENAELNRLLTQYKFDQSRGAPANTLSGLGRQVLAAAKDAGQRVTLPRAPEIAAAIAPAPVASPSPEAGKVNVTA